jgi:hypothetical protein
VRRVIDSGWAKALVGALVGCLAGGSIVAAQSGDTIHACVKNSDGSIAIISDPTGYTNPLGTSCGGSGLPNPDHRLDFSVQGPQGIQGVQGPPGHPGQPGANASVLFARVSAGGSLVSGSGGVRVRRVRTGYYIVSFPGNHAGCVPTSIPTPRTLPLARDAAARRVVLPTVTPDAIDYIATSNITEIGLPAVDAAGKDASGSPLKFVPANIPFQVSLNCPP